jgi:hypothetical protein
LPGKSWHAWDSTLVDFVYCNWKTLLVLLGFLIGLLTFYFFRRLSSCEKNCGA